MGETAAALTKRYVSTPDGLVHVVECGSGPAVVLLHQTPRSWDEYREVLPVLGRRFRAIAPDLPGMGASDPPSEHSIEAYARGIGAALDGLGLTEVDLVGHHTGGVVAVELAATRPRLVGRLVLSSTPLVDAAGRRARRHRPAIDAVEERHDGAHLQELWNRRRSFYPADRPDILARYVRDALATSDPEAGHRAVASYEMERRLGGLAGRPVLLVGHDQDPHAFPELEPLAAAIPGSETAVIAGGMVPLEHRATEISRLVEDFLAR